MNKTSSFPETFLVGRPDGIAGNPRPQVRVVSLPIRIGRHPLDKARGESVDLVRCPTSGSPSPASPLVYVEGVARESPLSSKRWLYAKRLSEVDESIISLHRARGPEVEYLSDGIWVPADPQDRSTIREEPSFEWLSRQEVVNLNYYLRSGETETPRHLNLEPPERYRKWRCPSCATYTIVPIVIGLPNVEDMEAAMESHIILEGCIVYGDEPRRPVGCTTCGWHGEQVTAKKIRELPPSQAFRMENGLLNQSD